MISYLQAAVLGLLQGISELFPISSLGHSVILPNLIGWDIRQSDSFFVAFLIATHLATAIVLFFFFFKEWMEILRGLSRSILSRRVAPTAAAKVGWLLVVGTIPAGIIGLLLEDRLRHLFASPRSAAIFLFLNGFLLWGAELLRRRGPKRTAPSSDDAIAAMSWWQASKVGVAQALALIPGFSRSGASMAGGLLVGLSHEDAARFSFLLATPIIGAAALLKIPELFSLENRAVLGPSILGAICAGVAAYISVRFLLRFFRTEKLTPFAFYCLLAGLLAMAALIR